MPEGEGRRRPRAERDRAAEQPHDEVFCNLELNLYNIRGVGRQGGLAIRVDGDPPQPPSGDSRAIGCPIPIHVAIRATYATTRIAGMPADELRFTVPANLRHPSGLDNTVRNTESAIRRLVRRKKIRGKRRKVAFYSAIGCKGRTRQIRASFTDEDGDRVRATKNKRC
jgi:hypothetical protein